MSQNICLLYIIEIVLTRTNYNMVLLDVHIYEFSKKCAPNLKDGLSMNSPQEFVNVHSLFMIFSLSLMTSVVHKISVHEPFVFVDKVK